MNFDPRRSVVKALAFIVPVLLLLAPARANAQDYWAALPNADLLKEARAAFHLGALDGGAVAAELAPMPGSLELVNQLLAKNGITGAQVRSAYRIKLQIFDRRGQIGNWEQCFAALPASLPGVPQTEWTETKALWAILHYAAIYDWGRVHVELGRLRANRIKGEGRADLALVKSRERVRREAGAGPGYFDLATAIAHNADWETTDPYFDPYFGMEDFSYLDSWAIIGPLLQVLGDTNDEQHLGLRRWFEFAAPSALNPLSSLFPDAPANVRAALRAEFKAKSQIFAPDLNQPVPATGGYRELLAYQIRFENLALTGNSSGIVTASVALGGAPTGIPPALWDDGYKIAWRTLGDAASLAIGNLVDGIPEIERAAALLPPAPTKALILGALGVTYLSQSNPLGVERFAASALIATPHQAIIEQLTRGLLSTVAGTNYAAVLANLAEAPYQPAEAARVRVMRGLFGFKYAATLPDADARAVLTAAITDAVRGLDGLERNQDPAQANWRDRAKGPLIEAVTKLENAAAANIAARGLESEPVRRNGALQRYAETIGGPSNTAPTIFTINTEFQRALALAPGDEPAALAPLAGGLADGVLAKAIASAPETFRQKREAALTRALIEEGERRGFGPANFAPTSTAPGNSGSAGNSGANSGAVGFAPDAWNKSRLRGAEVRLGDAAAGAAARATLQTLGADPAVETPVRDQAQAMLDALADMTTFEGYVWAQKWATFIEDQYRRDHPLFPLIGPRLADSTGKAGVAERLADTSIPPMVRQNEIFNIAQGKMLIGDDDAALGLFNRMVEISDQEMPGDEVMRVMAESWRAAMWMRKAKSPSTTPEQRLELYRMTRDYCRQRLTTYRGTDDHRQNIAGWGLTASAHMQDWESVEFFKKIVDEEVRVRIFQ